MKGEMATRYEPQGVEERWEQTWEQEGLYNADPDPTRESFVIAHPPPNVTGDLHMGHALQLSLADTIVRTRRMQGFNTLFQPGFDHAGISTQNAVELDRVLRRDAGVVEAGLEEGVEALHPTRANDRVGEGQLQCVAHMEVARHVRRRVSDYEALARRVGVGVVETL